MNAPTFNRSMISFSFPVTIATPHTRATSVFGSASLANLTVAQFLLSS